MSLDREKFLTLFDRDGRIGRAVIPDVREIEEWANDGGQLELFSRLLFRQADTELERAVSDPESIFGKDFSQLPACFKPNEVREIAGILAKAVKTGDAELLDLLRACYKFGLIRQAQFDIQLWADEVGRTFQARVRALRASGQSRKARAKLTNAVSPAKLALILAECGKMRAVNPSLKRAQAARKLAGVPGIAPTKAETIRKHLPKF